MDGRADQQNAVIGVDFDVVAKGGCIADGLSRQEAGIVGRVAAVPGKLMRGLVGDRIDNAFARQGARDLLGQYDGFR